MIRGVEEKGGKKEVEQRDSKRDEEQEWVKGMKRRDEGEDR